MPKKPVCNDAYTNMTPETGLDPTVRVLYCSAAPSDLRWQVWKFRTVETNGNGHQLRPLGVFTCKEHAMDWAHFMFPLKETSVIPFPETS